MTARKILRTLIFFRVPKNLPFLASILLDRTLETFPFSGMVEVHRLRILLELAAWAMIIQKFLWITI